MRPLALLAVLALATGGAIAMAVVLKPAAPPPALDSAAPAPTIGTLAGTSKNTSASPTSMPGVGDWINGTAVNARITLTPANGTKAQPRSNLTVEMVYNNDVQRFFKLYVREAATVWREWSDHRATDSFVFDSAMFIPGRHIVLDIYYVQNGSPIDSPAHPPEKLVWVL